jgi:hypothetical protein
MSDKITLPIIHSNGTGAEDLLEGYRNAAAAVSDAMEAIRKIEFNARDYYCSQDPAVWNKAKAEMQARSTVLHGVKEELMAIAIHCSDAVAEKESRMVRYKT